MSEWRPIETAPKDGTSIILGWRQDGGDVEVCFWLDFEGDKYGKSAWFNSRGVVCAIDEPQGVQPTHWMPLPEPPK